MTKKKQEDWVPLWPREPTRPLLRKRWWDQEPRSAFDLAVFLFLFWVVGLTLWYSVTGLFALLAWVWRMF